MSKRALLTAFCLAIVCIAAAPKPAPPSRPAAPPRPAAPSDATRGAFVRDRTATIDLVKDGIHVAGYRFDRFMRAGVNRFKMGSGPSLIFSVKNEGTAEKDFAIAVALFDKDGRLVGASSGGHTGKMDPGDSDEVKVVFHGVNRDVHRAATIFVTLETEP